ncbi:MAG TPA: hypothetical protein VFP91_11595, partial [Vicinamibacterales bacterium]|nr:hypothetical protein [Vicinamibacterales bacterium]
MNLSHRPVRGLDQVRARSSRLSLFLPAAGLLFAAAPTHAAAVAPTAVLEGEVEVQVADYADHSVT